MDSETTGIEPEFSLLKSKSLAGGGTLTFFCQSLKPALEKLGLTAEQVQDLLLEARTQGTLQKSSFLSEQQKKIFQTALEISPQGHLEMMAALQPFVSGAISKTVNLPSTATVQDIQNLYLEAWQKGLKALALYRDQSKGVQVLTPESLSLPKCFECGSPTEISGGCFRCINCGTVLGCS